jgi:hypothetical protein
MDVTPELLMPGLDPGIHTFLSVAITWMAVSGPGMTTENSSAICQLAPKLIARPGQAYVP